MKKIIGTIALLGLIVLAPTASAKATTTERLNRIEERIEVRADRASTTLNRLENRQENIDRIRTRIASTTASTSEKRLEKLDNRFEKQREQMAKVKDRLLGKELKVIEVLQKISDKIESRISILEGRGLSLSAAKAKIAEADSKLTEMVAEADNLSNLLKTEITDTNKESLFIAVRASQDKIRTLARATHSLLVDTIKEITKVLPRNGQATTTTATSTATTTN